MHINSMERVKHVLLISKDASPLGGSLGSSENYSLSPDYRDYTLKKLDALEGRLCQELSCRELVGIVLGQIHCTKI